MDTLVNIRKVKNFDDVINLRSPHNDAENCEFDLKILKVEASSYESLLNLILKERLPHDLNLLIQENSEMKLCFLKIYLAQIISKRIVLFYF